jgi:hypothetical protein
MNDPSLHEYARMSHSSRVKLVSGNNGRPGWFCKSRKSFGSMGQRLFDDDIKSQLKAAPGLAQQWAEAKLKELDSSGAAIANREVQGLNQRELRKLASVLVKARGQPALAATKNISSLEGISEEHDHLLQQTANRTGLTTACVKARLRCEKVSSCRAASLAMLAGPEEAVQALAQRCHHRGSLLGALRVAYDCPGQTPRAVITKAFQTFAEEKDHDLCQHVGAVAEELSRPLLPKLLAPVPASTLTLKCVRAHQDW